MRRTLTACSLLAILAMGMGTLLTLPTPPVHGKDTPPTLQLFDPMPAASLESAYRAGYDAHRAAFAPEPMPGLFDATAPDVEDAPAEPMPGLFDQAPTEPLPDLFAPRPSPLDSRPSTETARRDTRIVVYHWDAPNPKACAYCLKFGRDRSGLEVKYKFVDGRKEFPGFQVDSYPTFWIKDDTGKWHQIKGYETRTKFEQSITRTRTRLTSLSYPLRSRATWWTSPAPTREALIAHLQQGVHAGKFSRESLARMTWDELNALHSDDHEGRVAGGWKTVAY